MSKDPIEQERVKLKFDDVAPQGDALAHHDGDVVFAWGVVPGEEALVEIRRGRRRMLYAKVEEIVKPSPHRIEPRCPYFGRCTGCQWQHIDYGYQLELKRDSVRRQLQEVGGFETPPLRATLPSVEPWGYRNHARFTVNADGRLGFVHRESRRFIAIDHCLIMNPLINGTLSAIQGRCQGRTQISVRYGVNTESYLIQPRMRELDLTTGQKWYEEELKSHRFRISSPSFFQVNTAQAERMLDVIEDRLDLKGDEVIVDVFAGVGTFAALLAPRVGKVIAIEEAAAAVADARVNIAGLDNIEFIEGKAEEVLPSLDIAVDAAILDPPRAGCHQRGLDALLKLAPIRIAYVSCDPASLARDLRILCDGGYRLFEVQPVDMFSHTHHVECIATLVRGDVSPDVVLASTSPRRRELLLTLGIDFTSIEPPDDEIVDWNEPPTSVAKRLALAKADAMIGSYGDKTIIAADTIVVHDGAILGKPRDDAEAVEMLNRMRGRRHEVITALAVICGDRSIVDHVSTKVTMRDYSNDEIVAYVATGDAMDKAGAYAVQDPDFAPVERIDGCYLNVVGLPLCLLARMLRDVGVGIRPRPGWALHPKCLECEGRSILLNGSRIGRWCGEVG
ncbi:MAG: 23S rRNA (uracil(1939)-C(5))-methyltransferase RlmD [Chloroflexota bacterium]|nr:23S rRNA (uracil(1939)-C(5))-methyltransferase RlmD [Chloroflexota bacterium]